MTKNTEKKYTKVRIGPGIDNQERIWLSGTPKQIIEELKSKGFKVLTQRPLRRAVKLQPPNNGPTANKSTAA